MAYFAEFYSPSTGYIAGSMPPRFDEAYKRPIAACGDRAIIEIDGRLSPENVADIARQTCIQRGYIGYKVYKGESIARMAPVSGYWPVTTKVDNTAASAYYGN